MTTPTKRELERTLAQLQRTSGVADAPTAVTVDWREPDAPTPDDDTIGYDPETATLTYDLWEAQSDCLAALDAGDADIVAFLGGYGSGKSLLGGRWILVVALRHPGTQVLAMGTSFAEAEHTTFQKLFAQLPGDGTKREPERSPIVAEYDQSNRLLVLTNGSVIVLGSADSWNRYAGAEFGAIWLDEPSHYDTDLHDLLEMLGSRLRGVAGPKVQCWTLTGNGYNDAWEILEQRWDKTGDPIGLDIELVRASTLDNPYLDADTRERFERQYADTDRETQALHGGFAAAQGLVYTHFSRDTHVIAADVADQRVSGEWRVYSYDAGWNDPRVLLELGKTGYDQLVVLDMFYETESHVEDAIAWLERHDKPMGAIYCEHTPDDIDRFAQAGYPTTRATKALDEGIAEVRKRLEPDGNLPVTELPRTRTEVIRRSGRDTDGRRRVRSGTSTTTTGRTTDGAAAREGRVGLLVADRCQALIHEFLGYKEEQVGTAVAEDHCLDALRYACMGVAGR